MLDTCFWILDVIGNLCFCESSIQHQESSIVFSQAMEMVYINSPGLDKASLIVMFGLYQLLNIKFLKSNQAGWTINHYQNKQKGNDNPLKNLQRPQKFT